MCDFTDQERYRKLQPNPIAFHSAFQIVQLSLDVGLDLITPPSIRDLLGTRILESTLAFGI